MISSIQKREEVIPYAAIVSIHGHANFGSMPKRMVVDESLLRAYNGYDIGYTAYTILLEHKLLHRPRQLRSQEARLTTFGYKYLLAIIHDSDPTATTHHLTELMIYEENIEEARKSQSEEAANPE